MNIHPLIIHFPIALLTTYAVFELIRFRFVTKQPYWFYVKAILVTLGGISLLAAYFSGSFAKELITDRTLRPLISKHESFGQLSIIIFGILAAGYVVAWVKTYRFYWFTKVPMISQLWEVVVWIQVMITETKLTLLLAFLGLVCLFITGALGGSIIYGHANDPVTNYIYHLFFQ